MKKPERLRLTLIMIVLALLTVVCSIGGDNSSEENPITAIISQLSGKVEVLKPSVGEFRPAEQNTSLEINDQVLTGDDGRVKIDLSDGTIIRLSPLSNFELKQVDRTDQGTLATRLQLNIGRLWIILNGGELNGICARLLSACLGRSSQGIYQHHLPGRILQSGEQRHDG